MTTNKFCSCGWEFSEEWDEERGWYLHCAECGKEKEIQKVYGYCPACGYELTAENSTACVEKGDSDEIARNTLLRYHYSASPECKEEAI